LADSGGFRAKRKARNLANRGLICRRRGKLDEAVAEYDRKATRNFIRRWRTLNNRANIETRARRDLMARSMIDYESRRTAEADGMVFSIAELFHSANEQIASGRRFLTKGTRDDADRDGIQQSRQRAADLNDWLWVLITN